MSHAPVSSALQLPEVLAAEHHEIPAAPGDRWWERDDPPAAARALEPPAPADSFLESDLVEGEKLARRVDAHLSALASGGESSAGEEDRHYRRLAEWVSESRGQPSAAAAAPVTPAELVRILTAQLRRDLPRDEPWIRNADLRAVTRGLLKRHLQRAGGAFMRMLRPSEADPGLNRLLLEDVFAKHLSARDDQRLMQVLEAMRESSRSALCLSGGGIRSATFGLGVVQGLARLGVLGQFRYLSTVSGGGYLGSWLSAWSRHEGFPNVLRKLHGDAKGPDSEAAPVRYLRQYSNYMAPRLGLLSADSWTLIATYVRNLLLIWLVLLPVLAAVVALPWLLAAVMSFRPSVKSDLAVQGVAFAGAGMVLLAALLTGRAVAYVHAHRPDTDGVRRESAKRRARAGQTDFLRHCLVPLALAVFLWAIAWRWFATASVFSAQRVTDLQMAFGFDAGQRHPVWSAGAVLMMVGGALVHLVGWLFALRVRTRTRKGKHFAMEAMAILVAGAVGGFLLLLVSSLLPGDRSTLGDATYATLAVPGYLTAIVLAGFAFDGASSRWTGDAEREWSARYAAWILGLSAAWLAAAGLVLFGPYLLDSQMERLVSAGAGGVAGIVTALLGRAGGRGAGKPEGERGKPSWTALLSRITLPIAATVAVVALIVALSWGDMALMSTACAWNQDLCWTREVEATLPSLLKEVPVSAVLGVCLGMGALGLVMGRLVETNRFSLHAMYRARLIRAYLGASRPAGERQPDPFTGFDENDNLPMGCLGETDLGVQGANGVGQAPFHVLNLALNLVAGRNLAWQERKAASFTVSPLHAGSSTLGYRLTAVPGMRCPQPEEDARLYGGKRGITLGTAMTISGAAASPNMGYHSSPPVTFLMTLFNARLGWWLGNPGPAGEETYHRSSPQWALKPLLDEMLGQTDDTNPYVYLSDGGHFENLGLYEMVLRRNRFIVVSDAGCDPECTLQDLGNAIRKVRIDLGIPIEFSDDFPLRARSSDPAAPDGRYWAFARVRYSCVDAPGASGPACDPVDGVLLYLKPGLYGGEPRDVFNYGAANAAFPHETTADQFFSESQFESYRALGSHVVQQIARRVGVAELRRLFTPGGQTDFLAANLPLSDLAPPPPEKGRRKVEVVQMA